MELEKQSLYTLCAMRSALCDKRGEIDEGTEARSPGHCS
jgi:hypothetical protein